MSADYSAAVDEWAAEVARLERSLSYIAGVYGKEYSERLDRDRLGRLYVDPCCYSAETVYTDEARAALDAAREREAAAERAWHERVFTGEGAP